MFKRHDKTKPLPAPEGYRWNITESWLRRQGDPRPLFHLELWRKDRAIPESHGGPKIKKGQYVISFPDADGLFMLEHEIYRTSKKVIRSLDMKLANERMVKHIESLDIS